MPAPVINAQQAKKPSKDPVEKRIIELGKQIKVDLTDPEISEIRDQVIEAAMQGLTTKTIAEYKVAQLTAEADKYKKIASGQAA